VLKNENNKIIESSKKIVVGGDPRFIFTGASLPFNDVQVVGDTVYVSVSGDRNDTKTESGIFQSTALFDDNGIVSSWTPWQRAATFDDDNGIDKVTGFGVDAKTGNVLWLEEKDKKTIRSTAWGTSDKVVGDAKKSRELTNVLGDDAAFPAANEGVYRVFNFDEFTLKFLNVGKNSSAIAVGGEKVAFFQMGEKKDSNTVNPTKKFDENSGGIVTNDTFKAIAPLTYVEDERGKSSFLCVGGARGLARLVGIDKKNNFEFKKVDDWDGHFVTAMGSDGKIFYVLSLFRR